MTDASGQAPKILDLPIGLTATGMRQEFDSLGTVEVPANRYWGAQTQRSLKHFNIGNDRMPKEVYHAYGYVKKAAAVVNTRAGRLPACSAGSASARRRAYPTTSSSSPHRRPYCWPPAEYGCLAHRRPGMIISCRRGQDHGRARGGQGWPRPAEPARGPGVPARRPARPQGPARPRSSLPSACRRSFRCPCRRMR